jgi:hypothetical protein
MPLDGATIHWVQIKIYCMYTYETTHITICSATNSHALQFMSSQTALSSPVFW